MFPFSRTIGFLINQINKAASSFHLPGYRRIPIASFTTQTDHEYNVLFRKTKINHIKKNPGKSSHKTTLHVECVCAAKTTRATHELQQFQIFRFRRHIRAPPFISAQARGIKTDTEKMARECLGGAFFTVRECV